MKLLIRQTKLRLREEYQAVLFSSVPWRDRWTIYALFPKVALRRFRSWFRVTCPLPGDRLYSIQRDLHARYCGVDGSDVVLEMRSGYFHAHLNGDWDTKPVGAEVAYERVPEAEFRREGWMPA